MAVFSYLVWFHQEDCTFRSCARYPLLLSEGSEPPKTCSTEHLLNYFSYLVFFQLKKSNELFSCSSSDFIRRRHVCNGITECSDGSDEAKCQDGKS